MPCSRAEAYRLAPGPDTEAALFGTFTAAPGIGPTTRTLTDLVSGSSYLSADGKSVVMTDDHARVRRLDVGTGRVEVILDGLRGTGSRR